MGIKKDTIAISRSDFQPIIYQHQGNKIFEETLRKVKGPEELVKVLGRYIHFNSVFGCGAAYLTAHLGWSQNLFKDRDEPIDLIADRSVEVASQVFVAVVDEFGDRTHRVTHRLLAQATFKGVAQFFGFSSEKTTNLLRPYNFMKAVGEVRNIYRGTRTIYPPDQRGLFSAIGGHIASEILADEEFNILDRVLRANWKNLVSYLETEKIVITGKSYPGYWWIKIHTSVEEEHANAALVCAQDALRWYVGLEKKKRLKKWIVEGFAHFTALQTDFMKNLVNDKD